VVAESVPAELVGPIAARLGGVGRRFIAARLFDAAAASLGADPRATEPARVIGLVEPVPLLLIHGDADTTVSVEDGRRLASLAGPSAEHWIIPGAGHSAGHVTAPDAYEHRVIAFLRAAFLEARGTGPIIAAPGPPAGDPLRTIEMED
jgi:pimeloyl-ACP methyl ester carboxylesterase